MQKILVSIDTEGPDGKYPVEHLIYGQASDGKEYGINYLMDIFDEYHIKALFFVDIAEAWNYGTDKIRKVLLDIEQRGHDVGVHIHPDHMADKNRKYLWQYSYEEQNRIISKCTDFYVETLKRMPKSFRAGRYGANMDTLKIIGDLGYQYDMSEFYANKRCGIKPELTCNKIKKVDECGIIEVPVTTYKSIQIKKYQRFDKIDTSMSPLEFNKIFDLIISTKEVDVVSYFVHSFSLLDWRKDPDNPIYEKASEKKMRCHLKKMLDEGAGCFISENDLDSINTFSEQMGFIDASKSSISYFCYGMKMLDALKNKVIRNI